MTDPQGDHAATPHPAHLPPTADSSALPVMGIELGEQRQT
jgi:hypothetical protein